MCTDPLWNWIQDSWNNLQAVYMKYEKNKWIYEE